VSSSDANLVLGTSQEGLLRSDDGGQTFTIVAGAPRLAFIDWSRSGLYGVDVSGVVWSSTDDGTRWERRGELGTQPEALTVTDAGQLLAASGEGVVSSDDGGATFRNIVSYEDGASHD
jgi:photosystem II stability/assembly factor-like uncharacterized protein